MASSIGGLAKELSLIWAAKIAGIVWGPPGIGKSAAIKQLAASQSYVIPENNLISGISEKLAEVYGKQHTGRPVSDVRLVLCAPNDLKGIPVYVQEDRNAVWVMSGMFPASQERVTELEDMLLGMAQMAGKPPGYDARFKSLERKLAKALHEQFGVIFLDEITQAPPAVQSAAYSLILDNKINEYEVPPGVNIVAATNRLTDGSMTNKMPTALRSRLVHLEVEVPSIDEFEAYAYANEIEADIIGYLKFHSENLFKFDPKNLRGENVEMAEITFPCPRSWEFASRLIKSARATGASDETLESVLAGAVGNGAAIEFIAWRKRYRLLPDCEEILTGRLKRKDLSFMRNDGTRDVKDMSMEFTYIVDAYRRLASEAKGDQSRVDNFVAFITDASNSSVDWGAVIFKMSHSDTSANSLIMKKTPSFRKIVVQMSKDGIFA